MKKTLAIVLFLIVACWCLPQVSTADQVYFYHNDPAGTPLAMTDASGAVVWKADYKPFGEEHSTSGAAANDRRFVGKEKDEETGLSYFGARYEDAKTGRFIAPDSVRAVDANSNKTNEKMLLDPQRLNTYAYGLNNPYRFIDPDGNIPIDTLWDAANIIYDLFTGDRLSLAADSAALLIPYVPAGLTKISKAVTRIDPTKVRFSQSSIKSTFKDGKSIEDLAEGLRLGRIKPNDVPPIRLVERDGELFTLDNRRLEAFKRAGVEVPYRMASPKEVAAEGWKFTTQNSGKTIRIRGE